MADRLEGFDFDGVITAGRVPGRHDVIITGRSYEEAVEVYAYLRKKGIFNVVYFAPVKFDEKSHDMSGHWKARMIKELGVKKFYEDEPFQAAIIKTTNPEIEIEIVK